MHDEACRIDVWLWRARFFKSRTLAAGFIDAGKVRLTRQGDQTRVDKPARGVKAGDDLVFAIGGRLIMVRIVALGDRRGPPLEARALYAPLEQTTGSQEN